MIRTFYTSFALRLALVPTARAIATQGFRIMGVAVRQGDDIRNASLARGTPPPGLPMRYLYHRAVLAPRSDDGCRIKASHAGLRAIPRAPGGRTPAWSP